MKRGKEGLESYTEVDLLRANTIVTVRRTINSDNKGSKWSIDNRKASEKEVKTIMVELAIDVDNLCSFMPQDKVNYSSVWTATRHDMKCHGILVSSAELTR